MLVEAGAGEVWHDLVAWTIAQGQAGLENLALIPGTAGAAPIQNIGAYGVELEERFASLRAFDTATGGFVTLDRAACRFSYRDSLFKRESERWIVTSVTLRLPQPWRPVTAYPDLARVFGTGRMSRRRRSSRQWCGAAAEAAGPGGDRQCRQLLQEPDRAGAQYRGPGRILPRHRRLSAAGRRVKLAAGWLIGLCG